MWLINVIFGRLFKMELITSKRLRRNLPWKVWQNDRPHPQDAHMLIPEPMNMFCHTVKGTLQIKLRWILRWGDYLVLPVGSNVITRVLMRGRQLVAWVRPLWRGYAADFEDGGRSHYARNTEGLQKVKTSRKPFSPGASRGSSVLPTQNSFWTSDPRTVW